MPLEGLKSLLKLVQGLAPAFGPRRQATVARLQKAMRSLINENTSYRNAVTGNNRVAARGNWIRAVSEERDIIGETIASLAEADGFPAAPR